LKKTQIASGWELIARGTNLMVRELEFTAHTYIVEQGKG
jgi:hypothetical protein